MGFWDSVKKGIEDATPLVKEGWEVTKKGVSEGAKLAAPVIKKGVEKAGGVASDVMKHGAPVAKQALKSAGDLASSAVETTGKFAEAAAPILEKMTEKSEVNQNVTLNIPQPDTSAMQKRLDDLTKQLHQMKSQQTGSTSVADVVPQRFGNQRKFVLFSTLTGLVSLYHALQFLGIIPDGIVRDFVWQCFRRIRNAFLEFRSKRSKQIEKSSDDRPVATPMQRR